MSGEAQRRWRERHPERARAAVQRWKDANPEKYAAIKSRSQKKNRDKIREYEREWRAARPFYGTWRSMRQRCQDPNATGYERYGGP